MTSNPFLAIDRELLGDSGTSDELENNLMHLCDRIGPRFAGTEGYRRAADFMLDKFSSYGLDNPHLEAFEFNAWKRGAPAECRVLSPFIHHLDCYALPYGAATGSKGLEADLIDIGPGGEKEVEKAADQIRGRCVLTDGKGRHRQEIYEHCVNSGAAAFMLSGAVPGGMLGTGSVADSAGGKIPAASLTYEGAHLVRRQLEHGAVRIRLVTDCSLEPDTTWNVVAELTGTDFPDEWVVMGGHLDSHDIGPGAFDNGAGAVMVMEAARLLSKHRGKLRRTLRFIGFAGEEVGLLGSHHHAEKHSVALQKARFMLNCDTPALGRPRGLAFHNCPEAEAYVKQLADQLGTPLVFQTRSHCYSDHYPFTLQNVTTSGIGGGQFGTAVQHFAHMAADTPEKISITDLRECAAFAAQVLIRAANDENWPG